MLYFKGVKELEEESFRLSKKYPKSIDFLKYGISEKGNDFYCLKIGRGDKNVLMLGFPHSNEPLGGAFSIYYAQKLIKDKKYLDEFTFWIIPCSDPDSAILNEKWFTKDYSFLNEAIYLYRNKADDQISWSFPGKVEKEGRILYEFKDSPFKTKSLIEIMEKIKPQVLFDLHNSEFGGVYHYLTNPSEGLYSKLKEVVLKNNFPLHLGESELPFIKKLASSVFLNFGLKDEFNYRPQIVKERKVGSNPTNYCKEKYKTFGIISEIPLFWSNKIFDERKTSKRYKEAVKSVANYKKSVIDFMKREVKNIDNDFWKEYIKYWTKVIEEDNDNLLENSDKKDYFLTEAELFDISVCSKWMAIRFAGTTIRAAKEGNKKEMEKRCLKFIKTYLGDIFKKEKINFTNPKKALSLQEDIVEIVLNYHKKNNN